MTNSLPILDKSWFRELSEEFDKTYFKNLKINLLSDYKANNIAPDISHLFRAFTLCPFNEVKVVILGQDPYHGPGQAHGLAFSVPNNIQIPPSLKNIFKELQHDLGLQIPSGGNLENWARQGVLLLNSTLSVRLHQAASHQDLGWQKFTDAAISAISMKRENLVFLLWGGHARSKKHLINADKHLVLEAPHPSPLSAYRGFLGCQHFSKCNRYLETVGKTVINWQL